MINSKEFLASISARGVGFFVGVPDSLLANFCACVDQMEGREKHLITANEGNAVGLAIGYHMATNKVAMVYMQNSGLGNAVNPLASLADPEIYKIPMVLLIGWRGEPGTIDEPQHVKQGEITLPQLDVLGIPYWIIDSQSDLNATLDSAFENMHKRSGPVALVVRKETFAKFDAKNSTVDMSSMLREDALEVVLSLTTATDLIVSTTGKTSREVFELRAKLGQKQCDFLTVGGMGHTASIALGVAIGKSNRRVVCIDGDGSLLMHMGSMPVIAGYNPQNFIHILLNNGSHESVGGQATVAGQMNFERLTEAVGYGGYAQAHDVESLYRAWDCLSKIKGPVLLEIKIKNGSRKNLGRPTVTPEENKVAFMELVGG